MTVAQMALVLAAAVPADYSQGPANLYSASVRDPVSLISPFRVPTSFTLSLLDLESRSIYQKLFTPSSANADQIEISVAADADLMHPDVIGDSASQVFELRRISGLTWAQLSELFGVSKRAPFLWAEGKQLHPDHQRKLAERLTALRYIDRGSASENRALLFSPASEGRTYFELLKFGELELFKTGAGVGGGRPHFAARLTPEAAAFNAPARFSENFKHGPISAGEEYATPRNTKLRRVIANRRISSAGSS